MLTQVRHLSRLPVLATFIGSFAAAPAHALVVKNATLSGGILSVSGGQASRSAPITWEGTEVITANRGGGFAFTTTNVPADCIGVLSDGISTIDVLIAGCGNVPVASTLQATGQTMSYAAGDDGDLQVGSPLQYTDNGDGTVTDNSTGLMWEKKTSANVNDSIGWQAALDYVAALNAMNGGAGYAGHNDWRLPNMRELLTLVDYSRSTPPVDPALGPTLGTLNYASYWSSTSWVGNPQVVAWAVEFNGSGEILYFGKASALRVRAVRGAK